VICKLTSVFLILLLTCTAFAQGDTGVLSGTGSVYLNGAQLTTASLAVANGDVIQTKDAGVANLNVAGSTVTIESNTIVRFQSGGLALDRGSISVASGRSLAVFARDFKITPASGSWTEFYVSRASGVIQVLARTNNVTINCGTNGSSTVKQGQQISREDAANCGLVAKGGAGATPAAKGPILDSAWARDAGLVTGGALLLWVLTKCEDPVSPSSPTAHC
jgi:hypothetical protein